MVAAIRHALFAGMALIAAGCASDVGAPAAPPADLVPELRAGAPQELDADQVAAQAVDVGALSALLEDSGFEVAVERRYSGSGLLGKIRRVDVVLLRFDSAVGAERYLDWLDGHAEDLIGIAELATEHEGPEDAIVFLHVPDGCCPKETNVALAAWRRGRDVLRITVAGPGADVATAAEMAVSVDSDVEGGGADA